MNKKTTAEKIAELDERMQELGARIKKAEEILSSWRREFTSLWKEKERLERSLTPVTIVPTRGRPRTRGAGRRSRKQQEIDELLKLAAAGKVNKVDLLHQLRKALAA